MPAKPKPAPKEKPAPSGPVASSSIKVPERLGGGEVRLYDAWKRGLPDVVRMPSEKKLAETQWWLVHFPSRRVAPVAGDRVEGLRLLRKIEKHGEDIVGVLPAVKISQKRGEKSQGCVAAGAREEGGMPTPPPEYTEVPAGLDLDQAMNHVFPVSRITQLWEAALGAADEVVSRDGQVMGSRPNWPARTAALRELTQRLDGRPREKEKKQQTRPVVTLEEMRRKMRQSPEYLAAMQEMVNDVAAEVAATKVSKA